MVSECSLHGGRVPCFRSYGKVEGASWPKGVRRQTTENLAVEGPSFSSLISSVTPGHGSVPPTYRVRSFFFVNFWKYLHRHTQNTLVVSYTSLTITGGGTFGCVCRGGADVFLGGWISFPWSRLLEDKQLLARPLFCSLGTGT